MLSTLTVTHIVYKGHLYWSSSTVKRYRVTLTTDPKLDIGAVFYHTKPKPRRNDTDIKATKFPDKVFPLFSHSPAFRASLRPP